jgi:hypothetical protein
MRGRVGVVRTACLVALAALGSPAASAQEAADSTLVRTGFVPDPMVLHGTASGAAPLPIAEPAECGQGFFAASPSHVLVLETRMGFLRLYATGPGDLALAVRDAEGFWHCSDDRFGRHPSVERTWARGRVEVYVGTHGEAERSEYQLRLTEMRSMRPGVADGGDAGDERDLARDAGIRVDAESGRFDGIRLRRGFLPDPRYLAGDGALPADEEGIDASVLGGECHGLVSHEPSHTVELLDEVDFFQLYVVPLDEPRWPSGRTPPLSLVVLFPDGTFVCDAANAEGLELSRARWEPGLFRVWVGLEPGQEPVRYRLGLSEIRRVR